MHKSAGTRGGGGADNNIKVEGVVAIAEALKTNSALQRLDLCRKPPSLLPRSRPWHFMRIVPEPQQVQASVRTYANVWHARIRSQPVLAHAY